MVNQFYSLPIELVREIYDFDPTYKETFDKYVVQLIKYCRPKCTCSGETFGQKYNNSNLYFLDFIHLYNMCKPCQQHNPSAFDNRGCHLNLCNLNDFFNSIRDEIYTVPYFICDDNNFRLNRRFKIFVSYYWRNWYKYIPPKSIKNFPTTKRLRGRYKDMGHYQRIKT
jgi:hypothetical protein